MTRTKATAGKPDPKTLAWDDFRLIKAIIDARSLPAAAVRLGLNHSTVFRRLGQIEAGLGLKLFERHRSGYVATPAGEEMAALAERVDNDISAFALRLAGQEIKPAGDLRVTTNDTLLVDLLTPIFAGFLKTCPDIRLDLLLGNQALNLSKRDADVAIRATDKPPETLVGRRAARIAWALYGQADAFPSGQSQPMDPFWAMRWVSLGEQFGMFRAVREVLEHVPPERIVYRLNTVLGLAEAVEAGIGIGFLPCFIADRRPGLSRLAPPQQDLAADLWLLTHPELRHSPRVRLFLDYLAVEIGKLRPLLEGAGPGGPAQAGDRGEPAGGTQP